MQMPSTKKSRINAFIYPCPNCITLMMILWHQPWISLLFPSRVVKFVYKRNVDDMVYIYSYILSFDPLCYPGKVRIVNFLSFCNADTDIFTVNFTRLFCSLFASSILQYLHSNKTITDINLQCALLYVPFGYAKDCA